MTRVPSPGDDITRRLFADNTSPTAADDLKRLVDRLDVPGPVETLGGKPRTSPFNARVITKEETAKLYPENKEDMARFEETVNRLLDEMDKVEAEYDRHLTAVFHNDDGVRFAHVRPLTFTATPQADGSAEELIDKLRKAMAAMGPPGVLCDHIEMGKDALWELEQMAKTDKKEPLGIFTGIRVVLNPNLPDERWVAYDRKGNVLAVGNLPAIRFPVVGPFDEAPPPP